MNDHKDSKDPNAVPVFHPAVEEDEQQARDERPLGFGETIKTAFSLIFQLQKKQGLKRTTDLMETNPGSVIIAGVLAAVIFFSFCFAASQLVMHLLGV